MCRNSSGMITHDKFAEHSASTNKMVLHNWKINARWHVDGPVINDNVCSALTGI